MLKRILSLALMFIAVFCLCSSAFADVLWVPDDDYFYANDSECDYVGRYFILNGESGTVAVYSKPAGKSSFAVLPNGCKMFVSFSTEAGGGSWGVIQFSYDENGQPEPDYSSKADGAYTGWVSMDSLELVYDGISFSDEYGDEFYDFTGSTEELAGMDVVVWSYPGGAAVSSTMHIEEDSSGMNLSFDACWTDENGLEWAHFGYYYGWKNYWICLSAPTDPDLPHVERGEPTALTEPDMSSVKQPGGTAAIYLTMAAIAAVAAAICFIVYTLGRKNRA